MNGISLLDAPRVGQESFRLLDMAAYTKRNFSMFAGEEQTVTLCCDNALVGVIIDRFGRSVPIAKQSADRFLTHVRVAVSPQFFGWLCSLEGGVSVTAPESVKDQYRTFLEHLLESASR